MTSNLDTLLTQLKSSDTLERSQAILQLQPSQFDPDRVISALVEVLCTDDDLNIVEDATWMLVRYGTSATTALLQHITQDKARARHNIVHALGKIADAQAVPQLIVATQDAEASVRLKAVYALGQIGDTRAIDTLILRLDDSVQEVQWTAREVLATFSTSALPHLIHALQTESSHVQELAANLLGDLGDNSAVEPLLAALQTDHWQVRFAIVEALGNIGDARALPTIEPLADDPDSRVRAIVKVVTKTLSKA